MSTRRLLVTGASGFVGRHVQAACGDGGALSGWQFHAAPAGLDVRSAEELHAWVRDGRPDAVLHLAAQSFVPRSFEMPRETFEINLLGTLNLLQALTANSFKGRLIFVSSGDVYGRVPDSSLPVNELLAPEPRSPYAVSKLAAEQLCLQWQRTEGLQVMVARPFNHIGPGQAAHFVLPALAGQVAAISAGSQPAVIEAGDIDTTRDFTDVRDVVRAYAAMLERGVSGKTYLVASGKERRIRDLLAMMCSLENIEAEIHQDPAKMRPAEQRRMVGDASLLKNDTGWSPQIPLETTLNDILREARTTQ